MTLIFLIASQSEVLLVSDRRVSWRAIPTDEEYNKTGIVEGTQWAALYAFTGLVRHNHYDLKTFIADTLHSVAQGSTMHQCGMALTSALNQKFANNAYLRRTAVEDRAVTVAFCGFDETSYPFVMCVSNCETVGSDPGPVKDQFACDYLALRPNSSAASMTAVFGNRTSISDGALQGLNALLLDGRPVQALRDKAVELIRIAAEDARSGNTIGRSIMCSTLPLFAAPFGPQPTSIYLSPDDRPSVYMPTRVKHTDFGNFSIKDPELHTNGIATRGKTPRNAPCPCGSGRKFKHCCERKNLQSR